MPTRPISTPVDGKTTILFVPAIANAAAPTAAEISAGGTKDLSCWITADGWSPSLSEDTISDQRMCDPQTYEQPGRYQRSLVVKFIDNPKASDQSANNVAKVTLAPGTAGFLVIRRGVTVGVAMTTGDAVEVWPCVMGQRDWQAPSANTVNQIQQKPFITGPVVEGLLAA